MDVVAVGLAKGAVLVAFGAWRQTTVAFTMAEKAPSEKVLAERAPASAGALNLGLTQPDGLLVALAGEMIASCCPSMRRSPSRTSPAYRGFSRMETTVAVLHLPPL
jgi:hypothetical protein